MGTVKLKADKSLEALKAKKDKYVPRQQRHDNSENHLMAVIEEFEYTVKDYSRFGIAILTKRQMIDSLKSRDVLPITIKYGGRPIFKGTGKVVAERVDDQDNDWTTIGITLESELKIEQLFGKSGAENIKQTIIENINARANLHPEFVKLIDYYVFVLNKFKDEIDQEEQKINNMIWDERGPYLQSFRSQMSDVLSAFFQSFQDELNEVRKEYEHEENDYYLQFAQQQITPFFQDSEFGNRALTKPLGYAGDFEMMNQIYREGFEGNSLFGQLMHHSLINVNTSLSVKYRRRFFHKTYLKLIEEKLNSNKPFSSLSLASGPSVELQDVLKSLDQDKLKLCEFSLLDLDERALMHAQAKINASLREQGKEAKLNYIRTSVKTIAMAPDTSSYLGEYDFVYSAGLYDYLDLRVCKLLTSKIYKHLKHGGKFVIGNFSPAANTRSFLDLVMDWILIYKSKSDLESIAPVGSKVTIESDDQGIELFLIIEKQ